MCIVEGSWMELEEVGYFSASSVLYQIKDVLREFSRSA